MYTKQKEYEYENRYYGWIKIVNIFYEIGEIWFDGLNLENSINKFEKWENIIESLKKYDNECDGRIDLLDSDIKHKYETIDNKMNSFNGQLKEFKVSLKEVTKEWNLYCF